MKEHNLRVIETETDKDQKYIEQIARTFLQDAEVGNIRSCSLVWERRDGTFGHSRCSHSVAHSIGQLELLKMKLIEVVTWVPMEK